MPRLTALSLVGALLVFGCASVPETHYYALERLAPAPSMPASSAKTKLTVGVSQFNSDGIYARDNLLYRRGEHEIAPDTYRLWAVPPQKMLADITVDFLRNSDLFGMVIRMPSMSKVDLLLEGRILCFEEVATPQGHQAQVCLEFCLKKFSDRTPVWRQEFSASSPVSELVTPESIVSAMGKSVASCLTQASQAMTDTVVRLNGSWQ